MIESDIKTHALEVCLKWHPDHMCLSFYPLQKLIGIIGQK